jgi:hypothetical protein
MFCDWILILKKDKWMKWATQNSTCNHHRRYRKKGKISGSEFYKDWKVTTIWMYLRIGALPPDIMWITLPHIKPRILPCWLFEGVPRIEWATFLAIFLWTFAIDLEGYFLISVLWSDCNLETIALTWPRWIRELLKDIEDTDGGSGRQIEGARDLKISQHSKYYYEKHISRNHRDSISNRVVFWDSTSN